MTEIEDPEGTSKYLGDHDVRPSRPGLDSTSTSERQAPGISGRFSRAPSERRPSVSEDSGPVLRRKPSIGSARIQPLPTPVTTCYEAADADNMAFNPQDLLQEGLGEWQDRALSLQNLKKSSSLSASKCYLGLEQTPPFGVGRQRSVRRSLDSYRGTEESTQKAGHRFSTGGDGGGGRFHISEVSQDGTYGGIGRLGSATPGFDTPESNMFEADFQTRLGEERSLSQDFYKTLEEAPQASLIHLVSLYHQALLKHGHVEEVENITSVLAGLQNQEEHTEGEELKGMDLLLKEGLLKYLLSIQPHIPQVPHQVVKFKGLTYSMNIKVEKGYETMFTKVKGLLEGLLKRPIVENMTLLRDVTGYLMPGTLTLVVGPPGSGKHAFLNVIGGRPTSPGSSLSGTVTYNGNNVHAVKYQRLAAVVSPVDVHLPSLTVRETLEFARDCSQAFNVKYFSEELKAVMGEALKHGQDPKMELNLSMLGLKRAADRPVGNPMMPSLTEFQRHRLTTAEMLAGTYAVYIFDQLNAGGAVEALTFDMVTSVRMFTRVRQSTVLASILHPSEETFNLFDRIILLDGGQVMFQGPRQDVLPYFESLGYVKPNHFSTSEFLSDVTTSEGVRYLQPGYPKLEREDFIASFLLSPTFRDIRRVVDSADSTQEQVWVQGRKPLGLEFTERRSGNVSDSTRAASTLGALVVEKVGTLAEVSMDHTSSISPGDEVVAVGGARGQLKYFKTNNRLNDNSSVKRSLTEAIDEVTEPVRLQLERHFEPVELTGASRTQFLKGYVLKFRPETKILLKRELKVILRNKLGLRLRFAQVLIMSVYTGVVFFRVKDDPDQLIMNLKRGVFFISVLNMTLINLGQLPGLFEERAIYYKQQGAHFFRPQSFLCAKILGSLPFSLLEATLWTVVIYFMTDLSIKDGSWHLWVFYMIMSLTALNGASLVRFMAYFAPDRDAANALIGVLTAIFIIFAGFLVPRFSVPHYWLWAYYIDPLQWATTALVINEFNSKSYSRLCSQVTNLASLPQCVGRPTKTVGHAYVARGQFYTSSSWIAVAVAVLLGWIVLLNIGAYYALARKRHPPPTISPYIERKLSSIHQHKIEITDEEWGQAEFKLSLASIPVTLSWHELTYDVMIPAVGQPRTLLKYVSGWGKPGELVAFLGGQGAGRTTLLNCLAGRKVSLACMGGQILVNGYPRVQKTFSHVEGYVEDIMAYAPYMTVREGIEFSAAMRLSKKVQSKERKFFAEEVIDLVQIGHISNMLITSMGNEEILKEQSVRFAIASELAGNPSVLFLDEPMKGLDSHASRHIMECLKSIADTGKLVIACLQQPSPRELTTFSSIQLLKSGGETTYFGPVGNSAEFLIKYFEAIPGTPRCPLNKNPVTYALDVIGDGAADQKAHRDYAFEYRVSELALRNHIQLQNLRRSKGQNGPELLEFGYRAPYTVMAWEVMLKMHRIYWRNTSYNFGRISGALILALILGTVYFNINPHTTVNMTVKSQSLFILCALLAISNAQSVIPLLLRMNNTIERDQVTQQYSVWLHSLAWTFGEVPYLAVSTMLVCFVFCLMAQIAVQSAAQFFRFFFVLLEFNLAITFLGIFVVVISQLPQIAAVIIPIVIGFWTSTGGSVVPKKKILKTVIWVYWTNPLQYVLNALTSIAFFCDTNKPTCLDSGRNLVCLNDPTACPQCDCKRLDDAGHAFLWTTLKFNRSLDNSRVPLDMLALALFCVFFRVAAGIVITYRKRKRLASNTKDAQEAHSEPSWSPDSVLPCAELQSWLPHEIARWSKRILTLFATNPEAASHSGSSDFGNFLSVVDESSPLDSPSSSITIEFEAGSGLLCVKMPREIITLQVGQCGNQIGCRFWDMALREHASCNPDMVFDHALSSFFHNVDKRYTPPRELCVGGGNTPIHFLKARAVLIDMEEGVVNQLLKGSLAELFDSKQYITGASGSGNNWAQAHEVHGPQFSDAILEKVRGEAESCDSLQTFVMMHSIGGGTGSGVGSYILELLHDAYPEVYRFTQSIFPSADDDVITSPYNSLLSTLALTEHADCVLPVENQALLDIIRRKDAIGAKNKPNPAAERWSPKVTKPFDEMNSIASNLLLHLTSSMRFEGPLNVDLNEITMNLVPFPRLHFLTSSLSPHSAVSPFAGNQQRAINQLFTDVFSRETQLMKVNPTGSTYLACALLMRGNICTISDLQENVARMKQRLTMAHWNVEGFKVGLCSQPAVHSPCSLLCLANNTCIRSRFIAMKESFKQLYKRKVYVHHYTEYMDVSMFDTASNMLDDLIEEYKTLEAAKPPQHLTRFQPVTSQL